jgi:ATP-dependent RNA helicase DeaD
LLKLNILTLNKFSELGISPLLIKALSDLEINTPTEIQEKAIPVLNKNHINFVGLAHTGTGKTVAFGLPLLNLLNPSDSFVQALILAPTRELSHQIADKLVSYAKYLPDICIECISGGTPIKPQIKAFKQTIHVIVATPGRLIDLLHQEVIDLSHVKHLILDEADEMLSLGFKEGLEKIIKTIHQDHSTWLFSATMPEELKQLVKKYMKGKAEEVRLNGGSSGTVKIDHRYLLVDPIEKFEMLAHFLNKNEEGRGMIFCRTKASVQKLHKQLAINRFSSGAIHGDLPQGLRDRVMDQFKAGQIRILVASDVAARGIDIPDLSFIVQYHLPEVAEVYTHRSGRTARAGKSGISLSFVFKEEKEKLKEIENELGINIRKMDRPPSTSIDSDKAYLWAKRILKTQLGKNSEKELREKIGMVFQHLSKDELIDRLLADQMSAHKPLIDSRGLNKKDPKLSKKAQEERGRETKGNKRNNH